MMLNTRSKNKRLFADAQIIDPEPEVRAGKWSTEEKDFANRLILEFEAGTLNDCKDGTTLRSYLAKKLNCDPMRISKKYSGKCIGKLVYTKGRAKPNDTTLKVLEERFHKSFRNRMNRLYMDFVNRDKSGEEPKFEVRKQRGFFDDSLAKSFVFAPIQDFSQPKHANIICTENLSVPQAVDEIDIDEVYQSSYCTSPTNSEGELVDVEEAHEWKTVLSFFCGSEVTSITESMDCFQ